jgi:hypothetical protein
MSKTRPFMHSLKYINYRLNEKYDTYTAPFDQRHENKLKLTDTTFEVDGSKENNDILISL